MIGALLLALQIVAPAPATALVTPAGHATGTVSPPLAPQDWTTLPQLRLRKPTNAAATTSTYVRDEVLAGRCAKAVRTPRGWALTVELAILVTPDGRVRRVTPRAIDCPTVEQYAAGVILGSVREPIGVSETSADAWYRSSLIFTWAG